MLSLVEVQKVNTICRGDIYFILENCKIQNAGVNDSFQYL